MVIQILAMYRLRSRQVNDIPNEGQCVWEPFAGREMSAGIDEQNKRGYLGIQQLNLDMATVSQKEGYSRRSESENDERHARGVGRRRGPKP